MKIIILLLVLIAAPSYANDDLEQLAASTNIGSDEYNKIFMKIRYILGAAFNIHNQYFIDKMDNVKINHNYLVNIFAEMEKIKREIKLIKSEKTLLIEQKIILAEINLCMAGMDSFYGCQNALISLKNYLWGKTFGTDWSNYPALTQWHGFPDSMK